MMNDPLSKAGAEAPPIIGTGCTQRYDPEQMDSELGADFSDAQALWKRYAEALEGSQTADEATDIARLVTPACKPRRGS